MSIPGIEIRRSRWDDVAQVVSLVAMVLAIVGIAQNRYDRAIFDLLLALLMKPRVTLLAITFDGSPITRAGRAQEQT